MANTTLKKFLDSNKVKYVTISHAPAYTAQEIAANAHISGKDFAKTVIVKVDGKMAMVVEPAHAKVNFRTLKKLTACNDVELASEFEFQDRFPECELGAMPPFGNLYNMDVYISDELTQEKEIWFNAGSHDQLIKMSYDDYDRLVHPIALAA